MSIKGIWFVLIMYTKRLIREILKLIWIFLSKKRYIGNYPKLREFILKSSRIVAVVYIVSVPVFFQNVNSKEIAFGALIDTKEKIIKVWEDFLIERIVIEANAQEVDASLSIGELVSEESVPDSFVSENIVEGELSPSAIKEWDGVAEVSAYTSRIEETDGSPCISADNSNICEFNGCAIATNDYPLGSIIELEGFGECVVKDRMNARYTGTGNIDVYFGYDLDGALEFGRRELNFNFLNS